MRRDLNPRVGEAMRSEAELCRQETRCSGAIPPTAPCPNARSRPRVTVARTGLGTVRDNLDPSVIVAVRGEGPVIAGRRAARCVRAVQGLLAVDAALERR